MTFRRGDVVLVYFPSSDTTEIKKRPALIIQSEEYISVFGDLLVVPITSNIKRSFLPTTIFMKLKEPTGKKAGIRQDSVILVHNITNLPKTAIDKKIGSFDDMPSVDKILRFVLAL